MTNNFYLTTALFLFFHFLFIQPNTPKWWWENNFKKAETFIYNETKYENVIIGTSLSNRMMLDKVPKTFNLAFEGLSIYNGLSILKSNPNRLPKNIFIEINSVNGFENKQFLHSLHSPILYYPKKILNQLDENKRPIDLINRLLTKVYDNYFTKSLQKKESNTKKLIRNKKIENLKKSQNLTQKLLISNLNYLKTYIDFLEKKGVKIIFYEMPTNYKLANLSNPEKNRKYFFALFSPSKYKYITLPNHKFITTDGLHLTKEEAKVYTKYFIKNM